LQSAGTDIDPSQGVTKPNATVNPVPSLSNAPEPAEEVYLASESAGTDIEPSPSQTVPSQTAKIGQFGGFSERDGDSGDDEYTTLLAALAALQRIGISRERARVFGFRFRNEDWARAAQLIRETDK